MVLCHLAKGEKSVGELAALTGLRMAAVSQNLAVLRAERFVVQRRDGTTINYRLANSTARHLVKILRLLHDSVTVKPHLLRNRPNRSLRALCAPEGTS